VSIPFISGGNLVPNMQTILFGVWSVLKRVHGGPGDDLRLVKITKVVGVGCNFIKFGVETLGSASKDEIPVQRIIVSFSLDGFHLTCSQR